MKDELFCLKNKDVTTAGISDHKYIIYNYILFWNVMMQAKSRPGNIGSYNNGFGITENDQQYINRLIKIGVVIAEIILCNPKIIAIGLCEGPIQDLHINALIETLKKFPWMKKFFNDTDKHFPFFKPSVPHMPNWGLMMFVDRSYQVKAVSNNMFQNCSLFPKIANRLQLWQLVRGKENKFLALAHFPFSGDECVLEKKQLSTSGKIYSTITNELICKYNSHDFTFCGDFNFVPYLIGKRKHRDTDKIINGNSILFESFHTTKVTVDGILLSKLAKQKILNSDASPCLFKLKKEYYLSKSMPFRNFIRSKL